jgi:hypothetical protein
VHGFKARGSGRNGVVAEEVVEVDIKGPSISVALNSQGAAEPGATNAEATRTTISRRKNSPYLSVETSLTHAPTLSRDFEFRASDSGISPGGYLLWLTSCVMREAQRSSCSAPALDGLKTVVVPHVALSQFPETGEPTPPNPDSARAFE